MSLNNAASTDSSQTENKASCTWIPPKGGAVNELANQKKQTTPPSFLSSAMFVHLNRNPPSVAALQNDSMHISDKGGRHWRTVSTILRTGSAEGGDALSLLAG